MKLEPDTIILYGILMLILAFFGPWNEVFRVSMERSVTAGFVIASIMWILGGMVLLEAKNNKETN